jgi:hypothetical protein
MVRRELTTFSAPGRTPGIFDHEIHGLYENFFCPLRFKKY